MASRTSFDELNILSVDESQEEAIKRQIRKYFEEMDLDDEEIERRIALGLDLEKMFRNLFIVMSAMSTIEVELQGELEFLYDYAYRGYTEALVSNGFYSREYFEDNIESQSMYGEDGYVAKYVHSSVQEIVDTTILHIADAYYLSEGRAILCGENETNAVANYDREQKAIEAGFTTKTWVTMHDRKVRRTHIIADGETVGIFDAFEVGRYQMMFPLDQSLGAGAEEVVRCRCVCHYSGKIAKKGKNK